MLIIPYLQGNEIKATMRYHGTPARIAKTQVTMDVGKEKDPSFTVGGNANWYSLLENSMEVPQKVKIRTTLKSSNCAIGHLPKEYKNTNLKGYMHHYVYSSIIYQ